MCIPIRDAFGHDALSLTDRGSGQATNSPARGAHCALANSFLSQENVQDHDFKV